MKKETNTFKGEPITTKKPDYLTQEQWEFLKSGKQHHSEKTERARKVVARILEKDPDRFRKM